MKIWTAILGAFLLALIELLFLISGSSSYFPFLETAVFITSLAAFIKVYSLYGGQKYITWTLMYLICVLLSVSILDFVFNRFAFSFNRDLVGFFTLTIDYLAGALFGFAFRFFRARWKNAR